MKLLSKSDVVTLKSKERKMEIDEGVKLATRVDALREKSAQEETRLMKFRDETLQKLHTDIDSKISELDEWTRKVDEVKANRDYLLKPLDDKWDELHRKEEEVKRREEDCDSTIAIFEEKIRVIDEHEKELQLDRQKLSNKEDSINLILTESHKDRVRAHQELEDATRARINADILLTETLKSVKLRENEVAIREREVLVVETNNRILMQEIENEKVQLLDQRQTLEREINRLKK